MPASTLRGTDPRAAELIGWRTLAELGERLRRARAPAEIGFVLANETWRLLPYRQGVVWRTRGSGRDAASRLMTVSGLATLADETPNTIWLKKMGRWMARGGGASASAIVGAGAGGVAGVAAAGAAGAAGAGGGHPAPRPGAAESTRILTLHDLPPALARDWGEFGAAAWLVVPILATDGERLGIAAFGLDSEPNDQAIERVQRLALVAGHAWSALPGARPRRIPDRWRGPLIALAIVAVAATLLIPVRMSVLAPAEVVAWDAMAISAPMDGVIASFSVAPNEAVRRDAPLFRLDDTSLRARRDVAQRQLQVARADALAVAQKAFASDASRADLAALQGRVAERQAELEGLEAQLGRTDVRAPADGIVVFGDVNDWQGRPVSTGERVALLADPAETGVLVWLPAADALDIEPGAELRLFLQIAPLEPLSARLVQTSYQAVLSPDGIASYRLRARFVIEDSARAARLARIGLRGTAKLFGDRAPLGYYLFRRPLASLRQWTGW